MPSADDKEGYVATGRELLERYRSGERDFREAWTDVNAVLGLRGACLEGIDFSGAFIVVDFREANLRRAKFVHANVKTCDFSGADLTGADFSGAAIDCATFKGATLDGVTFLGATNMGHDMTADERPPDC